MSPNRVQRRRLLGWRKPAGAIYVGRGSKWGNPFKVGKEISISGDLPGGALEASITVLAKDAARAADLYRRYVTTGLVDPFMGFGFHSPIHVDEIRAELASHDLLCWCPLDQPCHADVLLEIANGGNGS